MITNNLIHTAKPNLENWGVGILLIRNGSLLLGRRTDNNLWGSPGGGVDVGETPFNAIIRETKEEFGLTLNPNYIKFIYRNYSYNENIIWNSFVFTYDYFEEDPITKLQLKEIAEAKWVPIENLFDHALFTPTKESIMVTLQRNPEILYPQFLVEKMTSMEQLLDVKNPGRNGGTGGISSSGNWQYKKPGQTKKPQINTAAPQVNRITELKNSYIQYFQKQNSLEIRYKVQDDKFVFPKYTLAKEQGMCNNKEEYMKLFKEQFVHFSLTHQKR